MQTTDVYRLPKVANLGLVVACGALAALGGVGGERRGTGVRRTAWWSRAIVASAMVAVVGAAAFNGDLRPDRLLGSYDRLDGPLVVVLGLLVALLASFVVERIGPNVVPGLLIAGGVVFSFELLLESGLGFGLYEGGVAQGGPGPGLLGHPSLSGAFVAMALVALLGRHLTEWPTNFARRAIALGVAFTLCLGVVVSGSRGGFLGLLVGAVVVLVAIPQVRTKAKVAVACIHGGLLIAAFLISPLLSVRGSEIATSAPRIVTGDDGSANIRLAIYWPTAVRAVRSMPPLHGLGVDGFREYLWSTASFDELVWVVRDAGESFDEIVFFEEAGSWIGRDSPTEGWTLGITRADRAHNYVLDFLMAYGWPAATFIILFVVSVLFIGLRSTDATSIVLTGSILAYCTFAMTWYSTPSLDPVAFALCGVVLLGGSARST